MSKIEHIRPRYVAVRLQGQKVSRPAFQNALRSQAKQDGIRDDAMLSLTRFAWPHAIVRISHEQYPELRALLPKLDTAMEGDKKRSFSVTTLLSSGSIHRLTKRLGILQDRGPSKKEAAKSSKKPANDRPATAKKVPAFLRDASHSGRAAPVPGRGPAPPPGRGPKTPP